MAYAKYVPGAGRIVPPRQQIAQKPQQGVAQSDTLNKIGAWRQQAQDAMTSGRPLSYFELQEGNAKAFDTYKRDLNWNNTDDLDMAKAMDGIVKKTAADQNAKDRMNGGGGVNFNWRAVANNLQEQDGLGFTRAVEGGARAFFADGNQQREFLARADAAGAPVSNSLRAKGGLMADVWDQQDRISGGDVQSRTGWFNPISGYSGSGYKSMGMGAGSGTSTPDWVVPGLADSNNPVSGGSTGAPQNQGEQRQYEDLLNRQRNDPTIFQDFNRESMAADLQKSYKKFAPTNRGAADNYNPQPPQGIMSPATGGAVGSGRLSASGGPQPGVFTNPMQRWTNEDGSRELKFDSNGMASGENGRYTPASGLYQKGRPENGGKRYNSVNEYAADRGLGIKDGTDPRRDYGLGQTGAGAGPIASATYDNKLPIDAVANWTRQGIKGDVLDRFIASNGGVLPRTAQQNMDSRGYTPENGSPDAYLKNPSYYQSPMSGGFGEKNYQAPRQNTVSPNSIAMADGSDPAKYANMPGSPDYKKPKKLGPMGVIKKTFDGVGQSWKQAPAPSPTPNGIPGVPNSGTGDGIKADSQLGDAPKPKKGLLSVLKEPLDGVIDSYRGMPNEEVDRRLEAHGFDQESTMHYDLSMKRKILKHQEELGGTRQEPMSVMSAPSAIAEAPGTVTNSVTSPANDVFERSNDVADHGNYDGRAMSMDRSGMLEGRLAAQLGVSTVPQTPFDGWKLSAEQIKKAQPAKGPAPKDGWAIKGPPPAQQQTPQKVNPVTRGFQKLSQMNPAAAELFRRAYAARH